VGAASPKRKKVLGERNDSGVGGMEGAASAPVQQPKLALSPPTPASRGAGPYDPKTNYTTPRPAFLRYDPERRREILLRVSRAAEVMYDDCSSTTSGTAASEEDGGSSLASDAAADSLISSPPLRGGGACAGFAAGAGEGGGGGGLHFALNSCRDKMPFWSIRS
jgi:hypothetical protein